MLYKLPVDFTYLRLYCIYPIHRVGWQCFTRFSHKISMPLFSVFFLLLFPLSLFFHTVYPLRSLPRQLPISDELSLPLQVAALVVCMYSASTNQ